MSVTSVLVAVGLVILGYLFGSLSPSVFLGRVFKGVDVRQHGSGNAGTTNAFRVLGARLGVAVLIGDALKGALPVLFASYVSSPLVTVFVAFATVVAPVLAVLAVQLVRSKIAPAVVAWFLSTFGYAQAVKVQTPAMGGLKRLDIWVRC